MAANRTPRARVRAPAAATAHNQERIGRRSESYSLTAGSTWRLEEISTSRRRASQPCHRRFTGELGPRPPVNRSAERQADRRARGHQRARRLDRLQGYLQRLCEISSKTAALSDVSPEDARLTASASCATQITGPS